MISIFNRLFGKKASAQSTASAPPPWAVRPVTARPSPPRPGVIPGSTATMSDPSVWTYGPTAVRSSNLDTVAYSLPRRELRVAFRNGSAYVYSDVSPFEYADLMDATSKGSHLHHEIKGDHPYRKIR